MNEREIKILTDRLIPVPREITFSDGAEYLIENNCTVKVCVEDVYGVEEKIKEWSALFWDVVPQVTVSVCATAGKGNPDAYTAEVTQERIALTASGLNGVMNAMKTLRQLAEVQRGTEKVTEYFLVPCTIKDEPALAFRGIGNGRATG